MGLLQINHHMKILNIIFILVVILAGASFFIYGTISPCEMLKKEVAMEVNKKGGEAQLGYMLLGGMVERGIDMLNPVECTVGLYKAKTQGVDKALDDMLGDKNVVK